MKPEQKFWRNRVRPVLGAMTGLAYERVELRTGRCGIPDVMYTAGYTGWIELKWVEFKPDNITGVITHINLGQWDIQQRRWTRTHGKLGAVVFLLVGSEYGSWLIDAMKALEYGDYLPVFSNAILAHWPVKIDQFELKALLTSRRTVY
jgi:hypothetical protein